MLTAAVESGIVAEVAANACLVLEAHPGLTVVAALKQAVDGFPMFSPRTDEEQRRYGTYRLALEACRHVTGTWTVTEWDQGRDVRERIALLRNVAALARIEAAP